MTDPIPDPEQNPPQDMQEFLNKYLGTVTINIFVVIGILKVLQWLWQLLACLWRQFFRPCCQKRGRLYKRYGVSNSSLVGGSWAVVTGGSDGIGLAICKKLAREGFNVCIVSRSEQKINDKLEEITRECRPGDQDFKTLAVVADLWQLRTIDEYKAAIADKLANIDVGVLVLNAGFMKWGPFTAMTNEEVERITQVNCNHVLYTAKVMVGQLVERYEAKKTRSALVVTSSIMSVAPLPGSTVYNASKTFATYLAEGLNYELKDKIDVFSYQPGAVATKMVGGAASDMQAISPESAADLCFRDIGHRAYSRGALRHELSALTMKEPPKWIVQRVFWRVSKKLAAKI